MTAFSFQLYSARNFPPWSDVLAMLSRLGYASVEGFGGVYDDPEGLRRQLDANGLTMPTGHFSLEQLRDRKGTLATAKALGIETIICPYISEEHWRQPDADWVALAKEVGEQAKAYKGEGFGFAWHNHHFEFWPLDSGRVPMEIILAEAPEADWEIDVAWVIRGGADPERWIGDYGKRIVAVHLKDIAPEGESEDEDGWADLGHGTVPWTELFAAIRDNTPAKHFIMEHDNPNDLERFAARSLATANSL